MKSEIRLSTISSLKNKAQKLNYQKYLKKVHINKLRAFADQTIEFDFPVTALIGPNGGGKTTVLSSCALLFKSVQPRNFFTKSPQFDKEM
ncbi:AAA family ATPase [Lacrimispora sp.]|uniref:AAA family ATPase n=1 Tax=Lacrimispora sp. TaxID=2719234 RepID=UPI0028AF567E|nr:AAA family ATPase [Lacrimispora sp.]